jgi:hypothetical protein
MLSALDHALSQLAVVEDHLFVAQQRSGRQLGPPTLEALDTARDGLSDLRARVQRTPLEAG